MERSLHWPAHTAVGFSLIETLIANAIVVAVALGVAPLVAITTETNRRAALHTWMAICAAQKIEELRTIEEEIPDGVEYLDARGALVPPAAAMYERRWSIGPLPGDPERLSVLQVIVTSTSRPIEARAMGVLRRGG